MESTSKYICIYENCGLIYENPVTLVCGNNLCKKHLSQLCANQANNVKHFKCYFCNKQHTMPENGFCVNELLNGFVKEYINNDPTRKKLIDLVKNLEKVIKDHESFNSNEVISKFFKQTKEKIKLHEEKMLKVISQKSTELIEQLNVKENFYKQNKIKLEKIDLTQIKNDMLPSWCRLIYEPLINQQEINDTVSIINNNTQKIENMTSKYEIDIKFTQSVDFEKYEINSSSSDFFGKLVTHQVKIEESQTINNNLVKNFKRHSSNIRSIQVDEVSKKIISASADKTIKITNYETGKCIKSLNDHQDCVTSVLIIPNTNKFLSCSYDKTIKLWDINTYQCLCSIVGLSGYFSLTLMSPTLIACGCQNGSIEFRNIENKLALSKNPKSIKAHDKLVLNLVLFDKTKLISSGEDADETRKIKIWNLVTNECIRELVGHSDTIYSLKLANDGKNLLSCSQDKTLNIWNLESGRLESNHSFENPVYCVEILDQNLITIGLGNGEVIIYDLNKSKITKKILKISSVAINQLKLLKNGEFLVGFGNGDINIYNSNFYSS